MIPDDRRVAIQCYLRMAHLTPMQTRVRISKELAESWTTREVLQASEDHLEDRGGFVGGIAGTEDR